jgi:hypothetical protein
MGALDGTYRPNRFTIAQDGNAYKNGAKVYNDAGDDIGDQLEVLDDLTAAQITALGALSTAEIGYLGAATPGTAAASKVAILGAEKNLDTLTLSGGAAVAAQLLGLGATNGTGLRIMAIDETITIPSAVAAVALTSVVPDGAILISAQANIQTVVVATTATKVGLGIAANPDAYGLTASLLANQKINTLIPAAPIVGTGEGIIGIYAVDNSGDAAGTINSGVVRVRLVYAVLTSLPNA